MAVAKIGGVAFLKVDGYQYMLRGDLAVSFDAFERKGIAGQDGVHGYTETPRVPYLSAKITDTGGLSLQALARVTDATVTVELANGKIYLLRNAWAAEARELNTQDGSLEVRFEGLAGEEILAAA
jgi:hypothetical protein